MIAAHHGRTYSLPYLRDKSYYSRNGVSMQGIMEAAEHIGYRTLPVKVPFSQNGHAEPNLLEAPLPAIVHWNQQHFVVVYKANKKHIHVADPAQGKFKLDHQSFKKSWLSDGDQGIALLLETTPDFYSREGEELDKTSFGYLFRYLIPHKKLLLQFALGLLLASVFQLIFPFLTQSIVDVGIKNQNIGFIYLILIAQLMLFVGQTSVSFIQNWIVLHIGTRLNISLISDFLIKLMRLPIGFLLPDTETTEQNSYLVTLALPQGLTTTYDRRLPLQQEMSGTAEIITEDKRILERVLEQVLDILRNN
jgi:ATP-binding cassette subfamily B protein